MQDFVELEKSVHQKIVKSCWLIFSFSTVIALVMFLSPHTSGAMSQFYGTVAVQIGAFGLLTYLVKRNDTHNLKYYVNFIFVGMIALIAVVLRNPELFSLFYLIMFINVLYGDRVLHYVSSMVQVIIYIAAGHFTPLLFPSPTIEDNTVSLMVTRITIFLAVSLLADIFNTYSSELTKQVHHREKEIIKDALTDSVSSLIKALEEKDVHTNGHSERTSRYAWLIAENFPELRISPELFITGGLLHDIGKIGIPDTVLNKKEPLSSLEFSRIKRHPESGAKILERSKSLQTIIPMVLYHHERYDGKGYPYGLKGEEIPLEARILSVADAFDAMTTKRSYRSALAPEYAFNEIVNNRGEQFCPKVVAVFIEVYPEILQYCRANGIVKDEMKQQVCF